MKANEFINEDVPAAGTDTEREVAQAIYMEGRCGVLAIAMKKSGQKPKADLDEDGRIARKAGQPANSKKHSDLYTDENPRGTITGLKFATVEDAKSSVSKIRNSGRSHAHKIQAAVAMEQRARAAGKASAAAVYRKYINANKKTNEQQLDEKCWDTYKQVGMKKKGNRMVPNCVPKNEQQEIAMTENQDELARILELSTGLSASGRLVQCRKKGAANYGNKSEGVAEDQLNELDMFAPVTTFIKMTDGSYIQADWRKSQGNPGLSDSASFVNFKPVNPNVAKQLGLDSYQRNNSISNHRDGTIVPGGPIQGSGPLANRGYEVVDYNKPETMKELPPEIKSELIKWVQKQSVTEESCPHYNGPMFSEMIMTENQDELARILELSTGLSATDRVELNEEFDLIESIIDSLADRNGVDAEAIWEDLDSLTDDELYVFAMTTPIMEDWQKANKKDRTAGMSQKAVNAYRRENPGSKLKTAVTTKPGKLKKGSKASKRRKSYCSRSRGQMKMHSISCAKTPDKAICKARRRWNC